MNLSNIIRSIADKQVTESDWSILVKEMTPVLTGYSYKYLNDQESAKDAVQDTFLKVFNYSHQFQIRNNLSIAEENQIARGWVMKINRNICLDILRSKKRRQIKEDNYKNINESVSVEEIANMQEFRELLRRELAGLSPKDQAPIILKYYSGMNNVEIAREIGCQPNSVAILLSRALEKLKNKLVKSGVVLSVPFLLKYMEVESASMGQEVVNLEGMSQFESLSFIEKAKPLTASSSMPLASTKGGLAMKLLLAGVLIATMTTAYIFSSNKSDSKDSKVVNKENVKSQIEDKTALVIKSQNKNENIEKVVAEMESTAEVTKEISGPNQTVEATLLFLPFHDDAKLTFVLPNYPKIKEDFKKSPLYQIITSREMGNFSSNTLLEILEENEIPIPKEIFDFIISTSKYLDENLNNLKGQVFNANSANIAFEFKTAESAKYFKENFLKPLSDANSLGCTSFIYQNSLFVGYKSDLKLETLNKNDWNISVQQNEFGFLIKPKFTETKEEELINKNFESIMGLELINSFKKLNQINIKLSFDEIGAHEKVELGFQGSDKGFFNLFAIKKIDGSLIDQLPDNLNSLSIISMDLPKIWGFVQTSVANVIAKDIDGKLGLEKKWNEIKSQMDLMSTFMFQSDFQKFISEDILGDLLIYSVMENGEYNSFINLTFKNEEIANKVATVLNPMKAMVLGADIIVEKNKIKFKIKVPNTLFVEKSQKSLDNANLKKIFKTNDRLALMSCLGEDFNNNIKSLVSLMKLNDFYGIKPKTKDLILALSSVKMKETNEWYNWQMIEKDKSFSLQVECPFPIISMVGFCLVPLMAFYDSSDDLKMEAKKEYKLDTSTAGLNFQMTMQKSMSNLNEEEVNALTKYDNGQLKNELKILDNKDEVYFFYDYEGIPYRKTHYNSEGIYLSEEISDNGIITETKKYSQGDSDLVEVFNKQSVLVMSYHLINNEFNGEYFEWYDSKKIKSMGNYIKNKSDGKWECFYENGNKKSKSEYKEGTLLSAIGWYSNGAKQFEVVLDKWGNGFKTYYYENGKVKLIAPINLNAMIGEAKGFYPNGHKALEVCLSFGSFSDYIRIYNSSGQMKREEKYINLSLGHMTSFYENGQKEAEGDIIGFNPCPKWQIFDESGKIKFQWQDLDSIDDNFRVVTLKYISSAYPFFNNKYFDKKGPGINFSNDVNMPYKSVINSNNLSRNMSKEKVFDLMGEGLKKEKFIESTEGLLFTFFDLTDLFTNLEQKDYYLWSIGGQKIQVGIFENNKLKDFYQLSINFKP